MSALSNVFEHHGANLTFVVVIDEEVFLQFYDGFHHRLKSVVAAAHTVDERLGSTHFLSSVDECLLLTARQL